MKVGYGWIRTRLSFASKQTMAAFGLLLLPISVCLEKAGSAPRPNTAVKAKPTQQTAPESDARTERLKRFFSSLHCPVSYLASDFVRAADENELDWRLLPSISVIESGGGKAYKNNNIFGWANGEYLFSTLKAGIHEVAYKLGRSPLYRNRDVPAKLHLYNPNDEYATNVMTVMNRISPVVHLVKASRVKRQQNSVAYATD
ncbi:MAG: hypothetical protein ACJ746_12790 [Bryobacteraceae bacterium]